MGLVGAAQMSKSSPVRSSSPDTRSQHTADYCASKAALVSLHESLRYELDKRYLTPKIRTTLVLPGHTHTSLFSHTKLPKTAFHRFAAPSLHPHQLAKAVIAAIDQQESRTIYLPFYTNFARLVAALPSFGRDYFQWVSCLYLQFAPAIPLTYALALRSGLCHGWFCQSHGSST